MTDRTSLLQAERAVGRMEKVAETADEEDLEGRWRQLRQRLRGVRKKKARRWMVGGIVVVGQYIIVPRSWI